MPLNLRMLGPTAVARQTRTVNGRTYTAQAGTVLTVPEQDGEQLQANGWVTIALSGPTTARPNSKLGQFPSAHSLLFWDETLAKLIVFDGQVWRDPATGATV